MSDSQPICVNLSEALSKAQSEITPPKKNRKVDFTDKNGRRVHYMYADLADVIEACRVPLAKNGLSVHHKMIETDKGFTLITLLRHSTGETESTIYPLPDPTTIKPQEFGSSLTYARRYSYSSIVGIASEEDDDGQLAEPPKNSTPAVVKANKPLQNYAHQGPGGIGIIKDVETIYSNEMPLLEQLFAISDEMGMVPEKMKEIMNTICKRPIRSSKDLTQGEIIEVIKYLKLIGSQV